MLWKKKQKLLLPFLLGDLSDLWVLSPFCLHHLSWVSSSLIISTSVPESCWQFSSLHHQSRSPSQPGEHPSRALRSASLKLLSWSATPNLLLFLCFPLPSRSSFEDRVLRLKKMITNSLSAGSQICLWIRCDAAELCAQIRLFWSPRKGSLCCQPALRALVRNSPVKLLVVSVQCFPWRCCSLHSTAAS